MEKTISPTRKVVIHIQDSTHPSSKGTKPIAYPVKTVLSHQALEFLETHKNEVAMTLIDHRINLSNGMNLFSTIKQTLPAVPVVIYTSEQLQCFKAIEMDADGYLNTSLPAKEFENYVQRFLRARGCES